MASSCWKKQLACLSVWTEVHLNSKENAIIILLCVTQLQDIKTNWNNQLFHISLNTPLKNKSRIIWFLLCFGACIISKQPEYYLDGGEKPLFFFINCMLKFKKCQIDNLEKKIFWPQYNITVIQESFTNIALPQGSHS